MNKVSLRGSYKKTVDDIFKFLWIVPGWITIWFWNKIVPYKKNTNWTVLGPVVIWSLVFYYSTDGIYSLLKIKPEFFINQSYKLPIAVFLSLVFGITILAIKEHFIRYSLVQIIFNFFGYNAFPEEISQYLYSLFEQEIILSTSSNKFYIGILKSASIKEDDKERIIIVKPSWSGYRQDNYQVIFDTPYSQSNAVTNENLEIMFPLSKIVSIAKFDRELHKYFIATGKTKMVKQKHLEKGIQ